MEWIGLVRDDWSSEKGRRCFCIFCGVESVESQSMTVRFFLPQKCLR